MSRKRLPLAGDPRIDALVYYRQRCASLERIVARLTAASPCQEHEKEIARLEQRVIDCENRWEEAETECYQLRKLAGWPLAG